MNSFFIEYRDPLFSVIIFCLTILIVSLATFFWNSYTHKKKESSLKRFAKRFEHSGLDDEIIWALNHEDNPIEKVLFLASIYEKSGEYERAIRIYLSVLENCSNPKEKSEIMELLGKSYLKAGFLIRSRDIFLEILKNFPRNSEILKNLLLVYENLNEYDKAFEIIEPLEELGEDVNREKSYFKCKSIINSPFLAVSKKCEKLSELLGEDSKLFRSVATFFLQNDKHAFWNLAKTNDFEGSMDILWKIRENDVDKNVVAKNRILQNIYAAKGYKSFESFSEKSDIFELESLKAINKCGNKDGGLNFEYLCGECKNIFPLYFERCPNCHSLLNIEAFPVLTKVKNEENNSLL